LVLALAKILKKAHSLWLQPSSNVWAKAIRNIFISVRLKPTFDSDTLQLKLEAI